MKPSGTVLRRPACTWLSVPDYEKLSAIAGAHNVTLAAYLRSIIVDVIADETARSAVLVPTPLECRT
jgi:hypothetical protein